MTHTKVTCSGCDKIYNIPNEKIPAKGAKSKCTKCKATVVIPAPVVPSAVKKVKTVAAPNSDVKSEAKATEVKAIEKKSVEPEVTEQIKTAPRINRKIAEDKLKSAKIVASEKGEQVKQRAMTELNKLDKPKRSALLIVVGIILFFITAKIFKDVTVFGWIFGRLISIFILAFFIFMGIGIVKGFKNKVVIFYDIKDAFTSFLIPVSLIAVFLGFAIIVSAVIGSELFDTAPVRALWYLSCLVVPAYFLYLIIANAIYHNNNVGFVALVSAICAKVGLGVLYPAVILHELLTIGKKTKKNSDGTIEVIEKSPTFLIIFTMVGGGLIYKMINGQAVYELNAQRSKTIENNYNE